MKKQLLLIATVLFSGGLFAQQGDGGLPKGEKLSGMYKNVGAWRFDQPDIDALRAEDAEIDDTGTAPWRFGFNNYTNLGLNNSGTWFDLPNGDQVWMLRIQCDQAQTINLTFDQTVIPEGNELYVYDPAKTMILGKFTAYHLYDGELGTELVPGSEVIVEYFVPAINKENVGNVNVYRVTHGYRTANEYQEKAFGGSGNCNMNVNCPDGAAWANQRNGAVMLVSGGNGFCSGSLINNTLNDGKPYVLTANHCGSSGFATWVFRFNWQAAACTNPGSSPTFQSLSGSVSRASRQQSDMRLVEITGGLVGGTVPASYNPYFPGWDNTNIAPSTTVCIHHPSGDIKKISFDDNPATAATAMGSETNGTWRVVWDRNTTTEGGSSGSPLFDQNKRIIGQLWGGGASCSALTQPDYYGRLGNSWNPASSTSTNHLVTWLDPNSSGATFIDGYDPNNAVSAEYDAGLAGLNLTEVTVCEPQYVPSMTLQNSGTQTMTSATITYTLNGGAPQVYNWSGSLAQFASTTVTLPQVTLTIGANNFNATVSAPNGQTDENNGNNNATTSLTLNAVAETQNTLTIDLLTDGYASETYMEIRNSGGTLIWSEGNELVANNFDTGAGNAPADPTNPLTNNTAYSWPVSLPALDCYIFTIKDFYGDGLNSAQWGGTNGSLSIKNNSNATIFTLNPVDFGGSRSVFIRNVGSGSNSLNALDANSIVMYPNPAKDQVTILASGLEIDKIELVNLAGQTIKTVNSSNTVNTSDLSAGVYLVKIYAADSMVIKQLVIR
jgi:lysyl endopeptidase